MNAPRPFEFPAYLRGLFMIFSAALFTVLLFPPAFISCFLDPSGRFASFFQRLWMIWLLKANGIGLHIRGAENVGPRRDYIIIANHSSILDIPAIMATFDFPIRFLAKKSLIWFPLFGWFLYFAQHVLVDRRHTTSILKGMKKATSLLKRGTAIVVFPEGTRSLDGQVKEFKNGAFLLALQSQTPILPVSISGTFEMLPRKGWCVWPGPIHLTIGKPILTTGLSIKEADALMTKARDTIIQNLGNIKAEKG